MKKNLVLRLCLMMTVVLSLYSCRIEEELINQNGESGNMQYGISQQAFLGSLFVDHLNSKSNTSAKGNINAMTAEELASRLDLEKAHFSSHNGEEILHAPVRVFGSYKRSLLSISRNKVSKAFLLTYPNPDDHRLFYITDLSGNLLKEVRIGEDGKETTQTKSGKSATANKSGDFCTETVFVTCSSGAHSFGMGNASECEFWNDPRGSPPNLFSINISCGDPSPGGGGGGGFENPSDPPPGGSPGTGGTGPVKGGGPPKNSLSPADCQQGLDCEECNIPGDTNNDCSLSYDEVKAMYDPCTRAGLANTKAKIILDQTKIKNKIAEATATLSTDTVEKGFNFGTETNGSYTAGNVKTSPNQSSIQLPPTEPDFTVTGSIHTHNSIGFDSFSAGDFYGFRTAKGINSSFETMFIFASTGAVYNLVITDPVKFQEFLNNYPIADYLNEGDWISGTSIRDNVEDVLEKFMKQGKIPDEAFALAHAFVLKKYNTGMSIAKKQPDGNFKTLFVKEKQDVIDPEKITYEQTDNCNL